MPNFRSITIGRAIMNFICGLGLVTIYPFSFIMVVGNRAFVYKYKTTNGRFWTVRKNG